MKPVERVEAVRLRRDGASDHVSLRDLWMIGVSLYWAEGTKQKPYNVAQRVVFTNSDPARLRVFLRWLREICHVPSERLTFELYIHESGHIEAAQTFWAAALQVPLERFRVRLKRHKLLPHRRNVGDRSIGLVRVVVRKSASLNRRITGWSNGIVQGIGESANGKPSDFGSEYPGSIPGSPAICAERGGTYWYSQRWQDLIQREDVSMTFCDKSPDGYEG